MSENTNASTKKEYRSFLVDNEELAYRIIDAGLLSKLSGATISKRDNTTKLYFFDKDDDVAAIIEKFEADREAEILKDESE